MTKKKVLLLGANGRVGKGFQEEYLRNMDYRKEYELILGVHNKKNTGSKLKVKQVDILKESSLLRAMKGIDVVINLAANPNPDSEFKDLVQPNLIGSYNVFECAAKLFLLVVYMQ